MGMMSDDLSAVIADAAGLGLADSCTYTPVGGSPITTTMAVLESPEPPEEDVGGEIRRRTLEALAPAADITSPSRDDEVQIATGAYVGTWIVIRIGLRDSASQLLTLREDVRRAMRAAGVERMPA